MGFLFPHEFLIALEIWLHFPECVYFLGFLAGFIPSSIRKETWRGSPHRMNSWSLWSRLPIHRIYLKIMCLPVNWYLLRRFIAINIPWKSIKTPSGSFKFVQCIWFIVSVMITIISRSSKNFVSINQVLCETRWHVVIPWLSPSMNMTSFDELRH